MSITIRISAFLVCLASLILADGWYIEAESIPVVGDWILESKKPGYTGEGYIMNSNPSKISRGSRMSYEFTVETAGTYIADLRGRRDREGVCENEAGDQCNDVYTAWDGGNKVKTMVKRMGWDQWGWQSTIEVAHHSFQKNMKDLEPGPHKFHLEIRSKGVKIDAIAIYKKGTGRPSSGTAVAEGPRAHSFRRPHGATEGTLYSVTGRKLGEITDKASLQKALRDRPKGTFIIQDAAGNTLRRFAR